ncbi:hypothetical protein [Maribellus maritimus]|uniref:hypothetical protein n=1 Tax=Maribellus maritimus TaxID=2870838 RepID=UPI001EEA3B62|nr:hypothetical protein [Maribellus maritimus]MCG6191524.1 hypothetical protein [Maribellus maritimus]
MPLKIQTPCWREIVSRASFGTKEQKHYRLGMPGVFGFDMLSKLTGKKFSVSAVRVKKFCATFELAKNYKHNRNLKTINNPAPGG